MFFLLEIFFWFPYPPKFFAPPCPLPPKRFWFLVPPPSHSPAQSVSFWKGDRKVKSLCIRWPLVGCGIPIWGWSHRQCLGFQGKLGRKHWLLLRSLEITLVLRKRIQKKYTVQLAGQLFIFVTLNGLSSLMRKSSRWSPELSGQNFPLFTQIRHCVWTIGRMSNWS